MKLKINISFEKAFLELLKTFLFFEKDNEYMGHGMIVMAYVSASTVSVQLTQNSDRKKKISFTNLQKAVIRHSRDLSLLEPQCTFLNPFTSQHGWFFLSPFSCPLAQNKSGPTTAVFVY